MDENETKISIVMVICPTGDSILTLFLKTYKLIIDETIFKSELVIKLNVWVIFDI